MYSCKFNRWLLLSFVFYVSIQLVSFSDIYLMSEAGIHAQPISKPFYWIDFSALTWSPWSAWLNLWVILLRFSQGLGVHRFSQGHGQFSFGFLTDCNIFPCSPVHCKTSPPPFKLVWVAFLFFWLNFFQQASDMVPEQDLRLVCPEGIAPRSRHCSDLNLFIWT